MVLMENTINKIELKKNLEMRKYKIKASEYYSEDPNPMNVVLNTSGSTS